MIKRVILTILLIVLILGAFFIGYYYNLNKVNELQNTISQLNTQNNTNKITKFVDNPLYCEEDSDCKIVTKDCGCSELSINIYNEQELLDCSNATIPCGANVGAMASPSPTIPKCINNKCQIAEREEECLVSGELCGPGLASLYMGKNEWSCCLGLTCKEEFFNGTERAQGKCVKI